MTKRKRKENTSSSQNKKRKTSSSQSSQNNTKKTSDKTKSKDEGPFISLLENSGFESDEEVIIIDDPIRMRQTLEKKLSHNKPLVNSFVKGFEEFISEESKFKKCLNPFTSNARMFSSSDSLCRLFLNITPLQIPISTILLEALPEYMMDESSSLEDNIPRLILSQFRWLDVIVDGSHMTSKLLEVLDVCSPPLQRDIIAFLPEIIDDSQHETVVQELQNLMSQESEFTAPVLDALSNLNLNSSVMKGLYHFVLDRLSSAEISDLPVVIRFLLQTATSETAAHVIEDLRDRLVLSSLNNPDANVSQKKSKKSKRENRHGESLVLESLRSGIRYKKDISTAYIKELKKLDTNSEYKILDVWVLFILFSMSNTRKQAETLFKRKISTKCFSSSLLRSSIFNHAEALNDYFMSLITLSGTFLRHNNPEIVRFGKMMSFLIFETFTSDYNRQETLGSLIIHIGSGVNNEIDSALDVMLALVHTDLSAMRKYSAYLQGMLDYLEGLNDDQLRKVYKVFALIAFGNSNTDEMNIDGSLRSFQDELNIIVRKQLGNPSVNYKKMGIIGACSIMFAIGATVKGSFSSFFQDEGKAAVQGDPHLTEDQFELVQSLFHNATSNCNKIPVCLTFLYDELSSTIITREFDERLIEIIYTQLLNDFDSRYICSMDKGIESIELGNKCSTITPEVWMNLDGNTSEIAINILPMVASDEIHSVEYLWNMLAELRLVQHCEKKKNDSLRDIGGILGCGMVLFDEDLIRTFSGLSQSEKEIICLSLFVAINFIRELINAFASSYEDPELGTKIIQRVLHVNKMESLLETCLEQFDEFTIPLQLLEIIPVPAKLEKKTLKRKSKSTTDGEQEAKQPKSNTSVNKGPEESFPLPNLKNYLPFMRELEIDVFDLLNVPSRKADTSHINDQPSDDGLSLEILDYLLKDLEFKMKTGFTVKKSPFASVGPSTEYIKRYSPVELSETISPLIPLLTNHLENLAHRWETLLSEHKAITDMANGGDENDETNDSDDEQSEEEKESEEEEEENDKSSKKKKKQKKSKNSKNKNQPPPMDKEDKFMIPCMHKIYKIMHKIIGCELFYEESKFPIIRDRIFVPISKQSKKNPNEENNNENENEDENENEEIIGTVFQYFQEFCPVVPCFATGTALMEVLHTIAEHAPESNYHDVLSSECLSLLKRRWEWKVKGQDLSRVISLHVQCAQYPLAKIEDFTMNILRKFMDVGEVSEFPTLDRTTFRHYFKGLLSEAVILDNLSINMKSDNEQDITLTLKTLNRYVAVIKALLQYTKVYDQQPVIKSALQYGKTFVENMISILSYIAKQFKTHQKSVTYIITTVQGSTRILQHMCGHGKISKSESLTTFVPALKKALEKFIYKVKEMLSKNDCADAFHLGVLKNRTISGEAIKGSVRKPAKSSAYDSEGEGEEGEEEEERDNNSDNGTDSENEDSKSIPSSDEEELHSDSNTNTRDEEATNIASTEIMDVDSDASQEL